MSKSYIVIISPCGSSDLHIMGCYSTYEAAVARYEALVQSEDWFCGDSSEADNEMAVITVTNDEDIEVSPW